MFDEPSSYLDVKQRLKAAITIRSLITPDRLVSFPDWAGGITKARVWTVMFIYISYFLPLRYIIVVEHDLSVLDYLSDFICCLYGVPSAYGVVTMPFSVREGTFLIPL